MYLFICFLLSLFINLFVYLLSSGEETCDKRDDSTRKQENRKSNNKTIIKYKRKDRNKKQKQKQTNRQ